MPLRTPLRKVVTQTRCLQQLWATTILGIQVFHHHPGSLSKMTSPMTTPASTISSFNKWSNSRIWTTLHLFTRPKMTSHLMKPCLSIKDSRSSRKMKRPQRCTWLREGRSIITKSSHHQQHLFSWSIKRTTTSLSNSKRLSLQLSRSLISTETTMPRGHPRRSYAMSISWGRLAFALSARRTYAIDACRCPNTALILQDISQWWHSK